ncbi:MAG: hypothetical protein ABL931_05775 [Usitatibacteraceae bacterium]
MNVINPILRTLTLGVALGGALPIVALAQTATGQAIGSWEFSTTVDQMTDKSRSSITVRSGKNEFAFQCDAPGPGSIYPIFVSERYLGGNGAGYGRRRIMLRFDTDEITNATWVYKGTIAFIPHDPNQSAALMHRATTAQKLAVRAITYDSQFADAIFELNDTATAIAKLREACRDPAGT